MGTRKRTGKGRHDKKGKGKKHHKKQHPQHEDWEPTGSGQESDTQSEPERSEPPTSSKQRRQRGHASANGKVHVDRATAGGWGWTPYIIGLVLCAGLAVTAPYLIQYYHLSGLDLTSFFSQSAKEKMPHSQPDFGQEGASDKSFGTDKQHSDDCGDDKHSTPEPERPQRSTYPKADITNTVDNKIRHELDEADSLLEKKHLGEAEAKYRHILSRYPRSPRATYGLAQTFCNQAEEQLSNALLEQCIEEYQKIIDLPDVPRTLMLKAGRTCVERQQFRGWGYKAVKLIKRLLDMYPDEMQLWNELGVQYLMIGRYNEAKSAFLQMLQSDPNNVYAKAHLGFIYKTGDNDPAQAVPLLRDALSSGDKSVQDGRFYFQLGDALQRLGNVSEAYIWYEKGESLGLFLSKHQRSLYNVEDLTGRPWWTKEQTGQQKLIEVLEENWKVIRDEGLANIDKTGSFRPEDENLRETGDWKQFTLFQQGRKNEQNCKRAPKTCALIERFPAASTCKRGQVKYSIMQPGVHVWPHCGPTNCRIRMHLGLVVPKDCCRIRVVDDIRTWQEGKVLVFDDSFEHEVWHNGTDLRLVLIVDIWHPELTSRQKASLSPI